MKINSVVYFDRYIVLTECSKSCELSICVISLVQVWGQLDMHMNERRGTDGVYVKINESQLTMKYTLKHMEKDIKRGSVQSILKILFGIFYLYIILCILSKIKIYL